MSVISGFFSPLLTAYITKVLEWGEGNEKKMVGIYYFFFTDCSSLWFFSSDYPFEGREKKVLLTVIIS